MISAGVPQRPWAMAPQWTTPLRPVTASKTALVEEILAARQTKWANPPTGLLENRA
jgi:hypothetical protein